MYRLAVISFAALSALLCGYAVKLQIEALTNWRRKDLLEATRVTDWASVGTCVGTISADHYSAGELEKDCAGSGTDAKPSESLRKLRNALAVSVHGLYFAYASGIDDPNMREVLVSVLSSTINPDTDSVGAGINHSAASAAITAISEADVPSTSGCDKIYNQTKAALEASEDGYGFYRRLLEGYKEDDAHSEWPLSPISVDCDGDPRTAPSGAQINPDALDESHTMRLYAHCNAQFQFASSGIDPWMGTFGIPLVGLEPGPNKPTFYEDWFLSIDDFSRTRAVDYNTKTRVYLGMRFGYSLFAYVPMLLCSCYLAADAIMLFLNEATLPSVLQTTAEHSSDRLSMKRNSLVMEATDVNSRNIRFSLAFLSLVFSALFWLLFSALPWGFVLRTMPLPECETGDPDHLSGVVFLGATNFGFQGSRGGWKADWDAAWCELAILAIQTFAVFVEGVVTNPVCDFCNNLGNILTQEGDNKKVESAVVAAVGRVANRTKFKRFAKFFLLPICVGAFVMVLGQALSGTSFGKAWADGIIGTRMKTDELTGVQTPLFDPVMLSESVYDQAISTVAVTLIAGLVVGVAVQRHLINGLGCFSSMLFFGWLALVMIPFFLLIVYTGIRPILDQDEATQSCKVLGDAGDGVGKFACDARWWSLLAGGGLLSVVLIAMTWFGALEAFSNALDIPETATVGASERSLPSGHPDLSEANAMYANASAAGGDTEWLLGHRSDSAKFFNFKTSAAGSSDTLLYAPRIALRR